MPRKNESQKLLWLGAMIAAPSLGTQSAPETCTRNQIRNSGLRKPRTSVKRPETPISRARRCASSFVMAAP